MDTEISPDREEARRSEGAALQLQLTPELASELEQANRDLELASPERIITWAVERFSRG